MTKAEIDPILRDLCQAFSELYGVRDVSADIYPRNLEVQTMFGQRITLQNTLNFSGTLPSGKRVHAHTVLNAVREEYVAHDLGRAVQQCSREFARYAQ